MSVFLTKVCAHKLKDNQNLYYYKEYNLILMFFLINILLKTSSEKPSLMINFYKFNMKIR